MCGNKIGTPTTNTRYTHDTNALETHTHETHMKLTEALGTRSKCHGANHKCPVRDRNSQADSANNDRRKIAEDANCTMSTSVAQCATRIGNDNDTLREARPTVVGGLALQA